MDNKPCILCNAQFPSFKKLLDHAITQHELNPEQYFIQLNFNGVRPTCKCGCGQSTSFFRNTRTFGDYLRGHISRVKNNWGNNESVLEKSHHTMREKRSQGECPAWNKGLTKETDERVAMYGDSQSANFTDLRRQIRSKRMKQHRLDGTIPTFFGPKSSRWKGGTSALSTECHGDGRLYKQWKFPKLQAAGFKCTRCGSVENLCIHHDVERMAAIIHLIVEKFGYDASRSDHELKRSVIDSVVDYHLERNVSGIVLCHGCHEQEHASLNF